MRRKCFFFSIWCTLEVVNFSNFSLHCGAKHTVFSCCIDLLGFIVLGLLFCFFLSLFKLTFVMKLLTSFFHFAMEKFSVIIIFPIFVNGKEHESKMVINVIQKKLGNRKELGERLVMLAEQPLTLSDLLFELTRQGLTAAQEQVEDMSLSESEIAEQAVEGRIKFAESYGVNNDTLDKAKQRTWQAFEDGLFRVFINREEITSWDAPLSLPEGAEVVFLQLTMLTGLYF